MLLGKVIGNVWATKKEATLDGLRFLLIRPFTLGGDDSSEVVVAADPIGAGIGETVIVAFGRAARHTIGRGQDVGYQVAVVGIVDYLTLENGVPFEL
ncbi:MAG: EutN/CcmL family microcompartment protein [Planctomycetes bacterium]|nr:EutN/CcmL family microcompartment protein [Planctomycetota bacterium]